ncbi:MAG: RagB/SusD family nutrient uptake outer membrane protein [Bacteroidales bacterium]
MMKKIFTNIMAAAALFAASSCSDLKFGNDFLEKAPGADMTLEQIFSSKLYAERELIGAYASLRTCLTVHSNNGNYEFQNGGNKIGWDNLDTMTDLMQSHCTWGGVIKTYYAGTYNAEAENEGSGKFGFLPDQEGAWTGIRRAWIFINNVDRVPDMTDEEKKVRKGEARMIIALQMHEMLRHFGGVPILDDYATPENEMTADYSRKTVRQCVDFIVNMCEQAAKELPWTVADADNGRMTAAGALALKARVLQLAARPLFNASTPYLQAQEPTAANKASVKEDPGLMTWLGSYTQENWQAVADACEDFFKKNTENGDAYRMVMPQTNDAEGYRQAFSTCYADRESPEIIIHTGRAIPTYSNTYHRFYFGLTDQGQAGRGYGGGCVTLNFVDMFTAADGTPSDYRKWLSDHGHDGTVYNNPFTGKDPRLYETVLIAGDRYRTRCAETWIDGLEHGSSANPKCATGFIIRKFLWDYNDEFLNKATNSAYIRLPELYLMYAEALNELGRSQEALSWLNKTRTRVGLPEMTLPNAAKLHSGQALPDYPECSLKGDKYLREEILDERAREFCFEEVRWFDIAFWKREDLMRKILYGIQITRKSGSFEEGNLVLTYSDPSKMDQGRIWQDKFSPKWFLSAFPSDEINKGYGLVQNPGW